MFFLLSKMLTQKKCERCGKRKDRSALQTRMQKHVYTNGFMKRSYCHDCAGLEQRFEEEYAREMSVVVEDLYKWDLRRKEKCYLCGNRNCLC